MKLQEALKASPTGYATRFDVQRKVHLFRTRQHEYVKSEGRLVPTVRLDGGTDWEPVLSGEE